MQLINRIGVVRAADAAKAGGQDYKQLCLGVEFSRVQVEGATGWAEGADVESPATMCLASGRQAQARVTIISSTFRPGFARRV